MPKSLDDDVLLNVTMQDNRLHLDARGIWTRINANSLEAKLESILQKYVKQKSASENISFNLSNIEKLDTFGAYLIHKSTEALKQKGFVANIEGIQDDHAPLLEEVFESAKTMDCPNREKGAFLRFVDEVLIKGVANIGEDIHSFLSFLGVLTTSFLGILLRPSRFNMTSFVHHIEYVGFRAVPIISLICFLLGAVIMQQGIVQLSKYGIEAKAVGSSALLFLREVAVLLTAILVAGRSSSAFTAEIGSMKMREEIDAMKTLGIDPIDTLVMPRILALIVILPALVFLGDLMCLAGGALMANIYLGMSMDAYLEELHKWITINHFFVGMVKTPFIALAIGIIGCIEGLKVTGSAESLGGHVTSAVVKSIFLVMILDAFFAILLSALNI